MSNLVIVAIPDENDRVWKISSEKKPHLTLLFLGDSDKVKNLQSIVQFVEHAVNTSLRRFYLPVDRRGELGEDQADVLFFKKDRYDYKAVRDFRMQLLKDNNIKTAYDSSTQREGPWVPHLTLGYPATPAKEPENGDDYGFYSVGFDKIEVWVDDFDGPEFLLTDPWDEWETMESSPMDIAMSDIRGISDEDLEHHGVKGMRWGVRKAGDAAFRAAPHAPITNQLVHNAIAGQARRDTRKELSGIKAKHPEYSKLTDRVTKPLSSEARAYRKDVKAAYVKNVESVANSLKNASGTRQFTTTKQFTLKEKGAPNTSKYYWTVKSRNIEHADDDIEFDVHVLFDDDGYIVDFDQDDQPSELAQSAAEDGAEFLVYAGLMTPDEFLADYGIVHYGVRGMHWGVRRSREAPSAVAPSARSHVPHGNKRKTKVKVEGGENHPAHEDAIKVAEARTKLKKSGVAALSNKELKDVQTRLNLEAQVAQLSTTKGRQFVMRNLEQQGQQQFQAGVRASPAVIRKGAKKAGKAAATTAVTLALL